MSQELERVYTIPLGKVLLSPNTHRAVRAINMIKEFARHHMKTYTVKIDEEVSHIIWARGVRSPPRKIRVRMTKTEEGFILVTPYQDEVELDEMPEKESTPEVKGNVEPEKAEEVIEVNVGEKLDELKSLFNSYKRSTNRKIDDIEISRLPKIETELKGVSDSLGVVLDLETIRKDIEKLKKKLESENN